MGMVDKAFAAKAELRGFVSSEAAAVGFGAAATSLWSWREMFKYLDGNKPEYLLGWALSEALYHEVLSLSRYITREPLALKLNVMERGCHGTFAEFWGTVKERAREVQDPVILALLSYGTYRALSDTLPHLVLRQEDPLRLRWNTADVLKKEGGPDLYEINRRWGEHLAGLKG